MKRGKKGQFYLIAAVIIILVILGLVGVKNYISVKKEPKNFMEIGDTLQLEGGYVVENAAYNKGNVNQNTQEYLNLFSNYMEQNTNEDFNMIIVYGDITGNQVQGKSYYRQSSGEICLDNSCAPGSSTINVTDISCTVNDVTPKTANCTMTIGTQTLTHTVPILEDNNFVFVMTTSKGLSQYIQTSF
jgi:hypothetical protein